MISRAIRNKKVFEKLSYVFNSKHTGHSEKNEPCKRKSVVKTELRLGLSWKIDSIFGWVVKKKNECLVVLIST